MATRSLESVEDLVETRNALAVAYRKAAETPISQYSMQDRQIIYEQRRFLRAEINAFNRKIGLADPTVNATGYNLIDLSRWGVNNSR